jgi:ABC-2 type transport system permease protein
MSTGSPVTFWRALWLINRIQVLRFARQLSGGLRLFAKKDPGAKRTATQKKSRTGWLLNGFIALSMIYVFGNIAYRSVSNIVEAAGSSPIAAPAMPRAASGAAPAAAKTVPQRATAQKRVVLPRAPGFAFPGKVLSTLTLEASLFFIAAMLMAMANGELVRPDWDLEWQATLPVPLTTLLVSRILARALTNQTGLITLAPLIAVIAWESGFGVLALVFGLAAALLLLVIAATVQTLCDTGLRLSAGPAQLRNMQAAISITAILVFFLAISASTPATGSYIVAWGPSMPSWISSLPPGLAVQMAASASPAEAIQPLALLLAEAALFVLSGIALLGWQLRLGFVAAGARESGRRDRISKAGKAEPGRLSLRGVLAPIQIREIRLLSRDRNFLVQTLVMPAVIIGAQLFLNTGAASSFAEIASHPEYAASIAFGISAYALMFSAFQTINTEGGALWLLYSVPQSLESILRQKAAFWSAACLVYPAIVFGSVAILGGGPSFMLGELAAIVLLGIPIFAVIGTALGVFASDPLAQTVQRKVKISYIYLYMLLASFYAYTIYAHGIWQRLALFVLTALLSGALWQKARDQLPYLLDPAASPPARVSLSDGLIAALMFFVVQSLVLAFRLYGGGALTGFDLLLAFSIAGAVTYGGMRLAFWRLHSAGVPKTFGKGLPRALALGLLGGAGAAGLAFVYLTAAQHTPLLEPAHRIVLFGSHDAVLLAALAIFAAPLFEEFVFRGLIFGGLRRSLGFVPSMLASAAVFALVHPPASVIPVFGLGLMTALVYERTKLLAAPMAAHAVYNALIVGKSILISSPPG